MATDATGTPTSPDNIPTYATSADAPSGKGFNAAMAVVQSIITQLKAGTLASGKIVVGALSATGTPSSSTFLRGDGAWAAPTSGVGSEVAFAEITSPVTGITATTEATATAILTAPSFAADGVSAYEIDFNVPRSSTAAASVLVSYAIYDNGASIGIIAETTLSDASGRAGEHSGRRRYVPAAGAHIYSIRVFVASSTYTATAGPGGSAQYVPAFIRVRKVT